MGKFSFLAILMVLLAFSVEGCKNSDQPQDTGQQPPSPQSQNPKPPQQQNFNNPLEAGKPQGVTQASALIVPTNPNQRAKTVNQRKGRSDPFELIAVQPKIQPKPSESELANAAGKVSSSNTAKTGQKSAGGSSTQKFSSSNNPGSSQPTTGGSSSQKLSPLNNPRGGQLATGGSSSQKFSSSNNPGSGQLATGGSPTQKLSPLNNPRTGQTARGAIATSPQSRSGTIPTLSRGKMPPALIPQLPDLPQPEVAKAVAVTGVIEINGVYYAIVKAPSDSYSRYVKAGDYLANGQVLVKRIEVKQDNHIVILEQLGIEVSRKVGDQPPEKPADKSTALVPNSVSTNATIN